VSIVLVEFNVVKTGQLADIPFAKYKIKNVKIIFLSWLCKFIFFFKFFFLNNFITEVNNNVRQNVNPYIF
jgi:hypothetical protein